MQHCSEVILCSERTCLLLKPTEMWKNGSIDNFFPTFIRSSMYIHCKHVHFIFSALKKKWQGKGELLSQLEVQVKQMKENFDIREKKLIEERNRSLQTQR